jgi:hypothetical protein
MGQIEYRMARAKIEQEEETAQHECRPAVAVREKAANVCRGT